MPTPVAERALADAADALVAWYARNRRDLPWRRDRDPYRVLVSEVMLQQTRVETVVARFERFVARFPDAQALADADEQEVLAEWSGLGYYRRARNLHSAARAICDRHAGSLPRDAAALRDLPGVGDYTAAALTAIAWEEPVLAIDGNVERVLCRLLGITADPKRAATRDALRAAAAPALSTHSPGAFNQALMDLGAGVCLPRVPRCDLCPCARTCVARVRGLTAVIPPSRPQRIDDVREAAAVIERDGCYLLFRGQRPDTLRDMWEFPTLDSRLRAATVHEGEELDLRAALVVHLHGLGLNAEASQPLGEIRHGITNRRIRCEVHCVGIAAGDVVAPRGGVPAEHGWFRIAALRRLPLAASTTRVLQLLGATAHR